MLTGKHSPVTRPRSRGHERVTRLTAGAHVLVTSPGALETAAGAWANLGLVKITRGDLDGAIADLSRAIELAPRIPEVWGGRGVARSKKGDREGARKDFERFLELAPNHPKAAGVRAALAQLDERCASKRPRAGRRLAAGAMMG
ncbi:tetratricopeptide repeat protein [bacterium]|nr:tetratricopeptide repeat protein [bacterium]